MILSRIRKSFALKAISLTLVLIMVGEMLAPNMAYALTSGPSQPEVQSFEPIGTTDMVDAFSGDFTYNIPLMDVDGYPINLSYHSGIGMDQEASWVGLGWNINPGVVNKNIRGIPDDFNGEDKVVKETNILANRTYRVDIGVSAELAAFETSSGEDNGGVSASAGLGIYFNNYRGMGYSLTAGANMNIGPLGLGTQMGFDNQSGIDFNPNISLSAKFKDNTNIRGGVSMGYNSRGGLKELSFSASINKQYTTEVRKNQKDQAGGTTPINGGASIDFAAPSYVPNVTPGMYSAAVTVTGKIGTSLWAMDPSASLGFTYAENGVGTRTRDYQAYGYLYAEKATNDDYGMMDVTREKEGGFSKYRQYLPLSSHAYDVYSVSGQGTGGVFRPYRGNIGTVYDAKAENENWPSINITIEAGIGPGPSAKIGGNIKVAWSEAHSGIWREGNNSLTNLTFERETENDLFEPVYFKNAGEKSINNVGYYAKYGNEKAVRVDLSNNIADAKANPIFVNDNGGSYPMNASVKRGERDKRNQVITYLTADMASAYGLEKKIKNYTRSVTHGGPQYTSGALVYNEMERVSTDRKGHHLSEVTTINPDGTRYVYGIPAYNFTQVEKTFNVDDAGVDCSTGLVDYNGADNTLGNENGIDHFYSATKLPPYAHSYLLTSVLSSDYIDITGNGPTEDDYGTYTKLNYSMTNAKSNPYKWRTPFYDATHNEGFKSDNSILEANLNRRDDKGSYMYGEKEVWYLNSIETKNHIAEFYVSPRRDAWGVKTEDQDTGQDTTQMGAQSMKLDSIKLYSKFDRITNGTNAVPIKVVHFSYNYELCKNVYNAKAGVGKLTLKRVWFTYGNNGRGALNDYEFTYSDFNPDYNMKHYDRWGNYKQNPASCSDLQNADFPYVNQENDPQADTWASAWHLKGIKLPSGGKIQINYESDDYACVQNKPSMEMFKIKGFSDDTNFVATNNRLYDVDITWDINPCDYLFFQMNKKYTSKSQVKQAYIRDMNVMYYNFLTNLTGDADPSKRSDYVAGYMEIEDAGIAHLNDSIGWIKIKPVPIGDRENPNQIAHPATKAGIQYTRVNRSELAYPPGDPNFFPTIFDIIGVVIQFFSELYTMIIGFNKDRMLKSFSRDVNLNKSWVRLYEPSGFKKGGGSRVQKVEFFDEWSSMTSTNEPSTSYGQEYTYEMSDPTTGNIISSGVASYEPTIGGDENPWRMPVRYREEIAGAPDNDFYVETPLGESYFPSASVGYRRVEIKNLKPSGVKRHGSGKTVYEFYTSAEFPTIVENTSMDSELHKPFTLLSFFGLEQEEFATASQGYVVELNDMHGKLKGQWNYSETDNVTPISGIQHFYKLNSDNVLADYNYHGSKLNNTVTVLQKDGTYAQKIVGEEIDMVVDANEKEEHNFVVGAQVNTDGFMLGIIPVIIPMILPEYSSTHNRIKTITATKVVNRYGILSKTVAHDNGASLATENLAWDAETGEVLLTKTQNEYRDDIYNLTYPAHWMYDGMGQAYKNIGTKVKLTNMNNGLVVNSSLANILTPGDELGIISPGGAGAGESQLWVLDVSHDSISIVYRNGKSPGGLQSPVCRITRSGRRNMQALPVMSLTSRTNVLGSGSSFTNAFANVINSSGVEYSQDWQMYRFTDCVTDPRQCSTDVSCYLTTNTKTYYSDMLNELISQERINTSDVYTAFSASNFWSVSFLNASGVSASIYPACVTNQYKTKGETIAVSGFNYAGMVVNVSMGGSCTLPSGWGTQFKIYSTEATTSVPDLINQVEKFIPTAVYCRVPSGFPVLTTSFYMTAKLKDGRNIVVYVTTNASFPVTPASVCENIPVFNCCSADSVVNPYIYNLKGNWRPLRNFVYYDKVDSTFMRKQSETITNNYNSSNTRADGTLKNYSPLWKYVSGKWTLSAYNTATSPWTWQSMVTIYSPYVENENKDALNTYSAALFGYHQTLPVAVAKNALMRQIAYDGFEDYPPAGTAMSRGCSAVIPPHWGFMSYTSKRDNTVYHTGKYSLKLVLNDTASVTNLIRNYSYTSVSNDPPGIVRNFKYKAQHLIEGFSPLGGAAVTGTAYTYGSVVNKTIYQEYLISYWVKNSDVYATIPTNPVQVFINGSSVTLSNLNAVNNDVVVEGWKRIERKFNIPASPTSIRVKLTNTSPSTSAMYYDDIRIQPLKSSMKTYAYDYITQRLLAQHDENNYATFYEYDEQGNLVRVKKETEKGIMTIQETRQNMSEQ